MNLHQTEYNLYPFSFMENDSHPTQDNYYAIKENQLVKDLTIATKKIIFPVHIKKNKNTKTYSYCPICQRVWSYRESSFDYNEKTSHVFQKHGIVPEELIDKFKKFIVSNGLILYRKAQKLCTLYDKTKNRTFNKMEEELSVNYQFSFPNVSAFYEDNELFKNEIKQKLSKQTGIRL